MSILTVLSMSDRLNLFWERADREQITPGAPRVWMSETTAAVRYLLFQKLITSEEAEQAQRTIHGFQVEIIDEEEELCLRALELAGKLGQSKAYDAIYLALADKLAADFWTVDARLANRCRKDLNLSWVHSIAEL